MEQDGRESLLSLSFRFVLFQTFTSFPTLLGHPISTRIQRLPTPLVFDERLLNIVLHCSQQPGSMRRIWALTIAIPVRSPEPRANLNLLWKIEQPSNTDLSSSLYRQESGRNGARCPPVDTLKLCTYFLSVDTLAKQRQLTTVWEHY